MRLFELWDNDPSKQYPTVPPGTSPIPLYHISFDGTLQGVWNPQNPAGSELKTPGAYPEPELPRISVAPTLAQCFQAIYPNISQFFEEQNFPHLDFHVYRPLFKGHERILTPAALLRYDLVHDAHMTDEYCILDPVFMAHVGNIRIDNTNNLPFLSYYPFNNMDNPKKGFAPCHIKVKKLP
jgi:hypothetical protein